MCMTHCAIVVFIKSIKVEGYFTTFSGDAVADRVVRDILTTFSGDAVADRVGEIFLQPSQATQWRMGW